MTACIQSYNRDFRSICIEVLKWYGFDIVSADHEKPDLLIYELNTFATDIPFLKCELLVLISASPDNMFTLPPNSLFFRKPFDTSYMIEVIVEKCDEMLNKT